MMDCIYDCEGKIDANPGLAAADLLHVMSFHCAMSIRDAVAVDGRMRGRSQIHSEAQRSGLNSFQQQTLSSFAVSCG